MEYQFVERNRNISLLHNGEEIRYFEVVKSLQNKIGILIKDLNELAQMEGFIDYFLSIERILDEEYIKETNLVDTAIDYAKKLVNLRIQDVSQFCDTTKKTQSSIFFDEKLVYDLLVLTGVFKVLAPYLHSKYKETHQHQLQDIIQEISTRFEEVSKQLYQIIRSKVLRGSPTDKQFMSFLKYSLSYDYLILYNYSFITTVLLCTYNWETNPVSFVVSLASDNFRYLVLSYSTLPINTADDFQEVSHDYLKTLSYETILNTLSEKLQKSGIIIRSSLYSTPVTECIVLPIMSYILDIPSDYLREKPAIEKLQYQYLFARFLSQTKFAKQNRSSWKAIQPFFMYAFESFIQPGTSLLPAFLEVLKEKFTYYGLESKGLALEMLKSFSVLSSKSHLLRHIVEGTGLPADVKRTIQDRLKELSKFIVYTIQDTTRDNLKSELKLAFLKYMGHVKLTKQTISLYI